jgi:hypothetical protein
MSDPTCYVRAPGLAAVGNASCLVFVRAGQSIAFQDIDVAALAGLWEMTVRPIAATALTDVCDEATLELLVERGVLLRGPQSELRGRPDPAVGAKPCKRIVFAISGAIASVRALDTALHLAEVFADEVEVIMTDGARRLLRPRMFEYFGLRTWTTPFEPRAGVPVPHRFLAASSELIVIAPASARVVERLANGACSDLLSLVVANTKAPVVIAPSMNEQMWSHPPIARNIARLRADGMWIVEPIEGVRAQRESETAFGAMGVHLDQLAPLLISVLDRHRAAAR